MIIKNYNWICSFWILLDFLGFFSLIQISWPIIPWKICVKITFFSWSLFLLWNHFCDWNILESEKNPFAEGLPTHCWQKIGKYINIAKIIWNKLDPARKRIHKDGLGDENPTKWHWEKKNWCGILAKIDALQNNSGIFVYFIRSTNALIWSFLAKLLKYLGIKIGVSTTIL